MPLLPETDCSKSFVIIAVVDSVIGGVDGGIDDGVVGSGGSGDDGSNDGGGGGGGGGGSIKKHEVLILYIIGFSLISNVFIILSPIGSSEIYTFILW